MHDTDLQHYLVGQDKLQTLHYMPDFISAEQEERLLREVHASRAKWVHLSGRRLQNHGGIVHTKGLVPAPLPGWLQGLIGSITQRLPRLFPPDMQPNHVLINAYQPGCGIMVSSSMLTQCTVELWTLLVLLSHEPTLSKAIRLCVNLLQCDDAVVKHRLSVCLAVVFVAVAVRHAWTSEIC